MQSIRGQCLFRGQWYTGFHETLPIFKIFTLIANKLPKHGYLLKIIIFEKLNGSIIQQNFPIEIGYVL